MSEKDWCVVGATVRHISGCFVFIEKITTDEGVWSTGGNNYCRTELTPLNNGLNGYRYGVEYPTNGKKPDLPNYTKIAWEDEHGRGVTSSHLLNWKGVISFEIIDERYAPTVVKESLTDDWYDYTNQKALNKCPVGAEIISDGTKYFVVAHHYKREDIIIASEFENSGNLKYISWCRTKPADLNKERVSFMEEIIGKNFAGYVMTRDVAKSLYTYGLRLIEEK